MDIDDLIDLNLSDAEEQDATNYEPVPAGTYNATIVDAILKANSQGTGSLVKVEFDLDGGNRKVWSNYNVAHQKPSVAARGKTELRALINACGIEIGEGKFKPEALNGKRCAIQVSIDPDRIDPMKKWNRVSNPQPIVAAANAPAANSESRPWEQ